MSCAWKTLFVQRAGGEGALVGARGAQGQEGPAGVGPLEDPTLDARGFRSESQKCLLDGARRGAPGWAGVAAWAGEGSTEPSQGVRSRAGGPRVGPELMVAGDRGASRPASHTGFSALMGDRRHPLRSDTTPASGDKPLWRDSPRFPLGVLFLEQASDLWCSHPSGHLQRMSQKPAGVAGRFVVLARSLGG